MTEADVGTMLRDAMVVTLLLGGPPLLAGLVVGLVISVLQAVTQINEATLAFVPKVLAIGVAMLLAGSAMFAALADYTRALFTRLIEVGAT
jgi:flagellar biosynthetic protein FliQ